MAKLIDADALKEKVRRLIAEYAGDTREFLMIFEDLIKEMPTTDVEPVERWISVDEKLPEYKESQGANAYWVAWKKRNGEFGMRLALYCDYGYAMEIEGIPTKVTWRDWDFHVVENVTHWMELPEPPKMDEGSNEL